MPHSIGNMDSFRWCMEAIQVILNKGKSKYSSSSVHISEHVGWARSPLGIAPTMEPLEMNQRSLTQGGAGPLLGLEGLSTAEV